MPMVPIDSPYVVSYSTSFDHNVVILMILNYEGSGSSKVNGNGDNQKPMGGFLSDLL